ncbi:unnamed protein product [Clonostachys solani]|uniref:F-box domain-containing protein n=1 Tax=Clonostachys solani TaxID=160281 RepID=A0A9N9Z1C6_9HYPO|nr:unnamed protein product [Clonostachys solani]
MASGALTQQPSTLAESKLPRLPNEVLDIICRSVPVESRIALALTCRRTFGGIIFEKLKGKKLTRLLLLLERDSPTRFVCFGCRKLRRLVRHPTQGWDDKGHELCGDHRKGRLTFSHETTEDNWVHCIRTTTYEVRFNLHRWQPRKDGPKISFSEAHLVMSRHRYGPRYGLSLDILKQELNFDCCIRLWTQDYFPLDEYLPGGRYGLLPEEPRDFKQSMYPEALKRITRPGWPIIGPGLWSLGHTYDAMVVGDELHVVRLHRRDENGWTLELVTYHRLGRCQTPDDPIWQCLASPSRYFGIGRENIDPSFGPGRTREKWHEALKALPGAINI